MIERDLDRNDYICSLQIVGRMLYFKMNKNNKT